MRTAPALLTAAALLVALTGCSVGLVDPDAGAPASAPPEEATTTAPVDGADAASESDGSSPDEESGSASTGWELVGAERDEALADATNTFVCDGELVLVPEQSGWTMRIDGDCEHLVLNTDGATVVVVGAVDTLEIGGTANTVFVDAVEDVSLNGDANDLFWRGDTPHIVVDGSANTFLKG